MLDRRAYVVVIVDQLLVDSDPESAAMLWRHAGLAVPLQINFALAGSARLEREMRSALSRRQREQELATAAAAASVDVELKNAVTGLLLESQLALDEEGIPARVENRLRTLVEVARRCRLGEASRHDPTVALHAAGN